MYEQEKSQTFSRPRDLRAFGAERFPTECMAIIETSMAVPTTLSPSRPKRSSLTLRVVIALLAFVLLLFLLADIWFFRAAKASLPLVDGTLHLQGLTAPVIVTRDSLGVPNISAQNLHDLFFAQGFVTAQDRLWQMDMTRRYASGDLSAILGPEYVKTDDASSASSDLRQVAEKTVASDASRGARPIAGLCRWRQRLHRAASENACRWNSA